MTDKEWVDILGDTYRFAVVIGDVDINEDKYDKVHRLNNLQRFKSVQYGGKRPNIVVYERDSVDKEWLYRVVLSGMNTDGFEMDIR